MSEPVAADDATGQPRTSAEDWLNLARKMLVEEGIGAVKVQTLAQRLGVSRSSFYWFFDSAADLKDQLIGLWLAKNTGPIIERAMRPAPDIITAIVGIFECWVDPDLFDPDLDMAVRVWARHEDPIKAIVRQADSQRLDALAAMFGRHGFEPLDAIVKARVIYFTQIGQYALEVNEPMPVRHRTVIPYLRAFSGQEPTEEHVARLEAYMRRRGIDF